MNPIQKIRTEIGLSQQEFAKNIGVSQSAISQAELGKTTVRPDTAKKIIHLCLKKGKKISLEDIYFNEGLNE